MSRRQIPQPQEAALFPPVRGLYKPFRSGNPLMNQGRASTFNGWRIADGHARIIEGNVATNGKSTTVTTNMKCIVPYFDPFGAADYAILFYVCGQKCIQQPINGVGSEAVLNATLLGADTQALIAWGRFREHILIADTVGGLFWIQPGTVRSAGVTAPGSAPSLADDGTGAQPPAATYTVKVTFVNDKGHEGNGSAASSAVVASGGQIDWTSIPTGPAGTASRNLYRHASAGTSYLLAGSIADNSTTTFTDTVADASLGRQLDSDNDVPIDTLRDIAISPARVFLLAMDGLTIWASKIEAITGQANWEAYPSGLSLDMPFDGANDDAKAIIFTHGDLYVFGGSKIFRMVGDIATGVSVEDISVDMGIFSTHAKCETSDGWIILSNQKQLWGYSPISGQLTRLASGVQGELAQIERNTGLDGPTITFDSGYNCVYLHYGKSAAGDNNLDMGIDLSSGEVFTPGWNYEFSEYSKDFRQLFGARPDTNVIRGWWPSHAVAVTYANINGSAPTDQRIEWVMYTPSPGDDIHFLGLSFVIKSQVNAAGVIPLLKVEWSLDGTARYRTALINVDRERLTTQEGEISPNVHAYVPIDLVAKYLTLRISVVETAGRAGGMELYAGMLSYSNKSESREGQKSIPEGLSRVYT